MLGQARFQQRLLRVGQFPFVEPIVAVNFVDFLHYFASLFASELGQLGQDFCFAHDRKLMLGRGGSKPLEVMCRGLV